MDRNLLDPILKEESVKGLDETILVLTVGILDRAQCSHDVESEWREVGGQVIADRY